ncbi:metal-dependent hydrolase [Sporotomaculum syntrophicum]|uniref:Metal-dependent hydrolase n=1 Tax=Sporotomaculum syntrophicum TaxID=182264 RepID=A0A9D3AWE7_9FIRM|nr:MBL fold metallo-hydrolase [Sporotomaculum syntrophicum]KAF1085330.1 metal-dependent hydrolase [Sporotomaculum syntrophicum]
MQIQWLGHACFSLTLSNGKRIITDPFDKNVGYPQPQLTADIVTVSHQHSDHNAVQLVPGNPVAVKAVGQYAFNDINITGIPSYHDTRQGKQRGSNIIFIIEAEGLRACHLGDLGHILDPEQVKQIGSTDVLFIPVGGYFTIGAEDAVKVVEQLKPNYVIPMHYKTNYIDFPISTPDEFIKYYPGYQVNQELTLKAEKVSAAPKVIMLELNSK